MQEDFSSLIHRFETKYAVGTAAAAFLRDAIADHVPVFQFKPGRPVTHITTVYYDTRTNDLYERAARSYDDNVKLRVKEYWYLVAHRGEVVHDVSSVCFVEIKQRVCGRVVKKRFGLPKRRLAALFRGEDVWNEVVRPPQPDAVARLRAIYDEFRAFLRVHEVAPSSTISYRRRVYQMPDESLRVTFDDEIAVYPPLPGLYEQVESLTSDVLGAPSYRGKNVILEIKSPGKLPDWLVRAFRNHSSRPLSKFTTSVRALRSEADGSEFSSMPQNGNGQRADNGDTQRIAENFH